MAIYNLIDIKRPEVIMGILIDNFKVGGIKLKYSRVKKYSTSAEEEVIFLKPYKSIWSPKGKKFCKRGEYGNTMSPFSNVWLKVELDYTNYEEECDIIKNGIEKVIDQNLIKHLNRFSKSFIIEEIDEVPITSLKKRIYLSIMIFFMNIKNQIINQKSK